MHNSTDRYSTGSFATASDKITNSLKAECVFFSESFSTLFPPKTIAAFWLPLFCYRRQSLVRRTQDQESAHLGLTLGYASELPGLFHHPMEITSTSVSLYLSSCTLQVLWAELSLHVQHVQCITNPQSWPRASNTKMNQIIVTKCQKMHSQKNQMVGRRPAKKWDFFPFSLFSFVQLSTLYVNPTNIHPKSKSHSLLVFLD